MGLLKELPLGLVGALGGAVGSELIQGLLTWSPLDGESVLWETPPQR